MFYDIKYVRIIKDNLIRYWKDIIIDFITFKGGKDLRLKDIKKRIKADVLCGEEFLDTDVQYAFGSDLMSDVLAYVKGNTLLLTGLTNPQVIRTAEMADVVAILFVRGKIPGQDVIDLAMENQMAVLTTKYTLYTTSGILYSEGLRGIEVE